MLTTHVDHSHCPLTIDGNGGIDIDCRATYCLVLATCCWPLSQVP